MPDLENPYIDGNKNPQLRRSVIAFVDILGYETLVRQAAKSPEESNKLLLTLRKALDDSIATLGNPKGHKLFGKYPFMIRTFTDNIVISYPVIGGPINRHAEPEFGRIFSSLAFFQFLMVRSGFFVRGAISIGEIYIDDELIYGDGFIEAYDGERQLANFPRIVLTGSAQDAIHYHLKWYAEPQYAPQYYDLYKDTDSQMFLNYLEKVLVGESEQGPFYDELLKHKETVEKKLIEYKGQPKIWEKYAWVANYHNYFCGQNKLYFDSKFMIDLSKLQVQPTRIA